MEKEMKDLIEISQLYGKDKEYVIAGGGNTSYKNNDYLWIKASGIALSDISEDGFVRMSRERLKVISEREYSSNSDERESQVKEDLAAAIDSKNGLRPSVETSMHDVINYPFVIHTHPTVVNALSCSKDSEKLTKELLGEDVLFIEYIDPGYVLFKRVASDIAKYNEKYGFDPKVILLENHGIFVSADSTEEVKSIYTGIELKLLAHINLTLPSDNTDGVVPQIASGIDQHYDEGDAAFKAVVTNPLIEQFVKDATSFGAIATAFTPDHIVYCKSRYLFFDENSKDELTTLIAAFKKKYSFPPRIIGLKEKGLLIVADNEKSGTIIMQLIQNMMKIALLANGLGGSKPMTDTQIEFIENWEVENYRKKMAKK